MSFLKNLTQRNNNNGNNDNTTETNVESLPQAQAIWPPTGYQNMDTTLTDNTTTTVLHRRNNRRASYKGFSTSISHMFQQHSPTTTTTTTNKSTNRIDCCAFACFGIFQHDYNRYVVTGITPPSFLRRFMMHIFFPLVVFCLAGWASLHIADMHVNRVVCTVLVVVIVIYCGMRCCRSRVKRVELRREILSQRQRQMEGVVEGEEQTDWELNCAHALCGCFKNDFPHDAIDEVNNNNNNSGNGEEEDLCGCMWKCFSKLCCDTCCNCFYIFCGICAIAQEGREVEQMIPVERRRIDYVTFQSYLDYYPAIQNLRTNSNTSLKDHYKAISKLSLKLLKFLGFVTFCLLVFALIPTRRKGNEFYLGDFIVFLATFGQAFIILYLVHWHSNKFDLSADAVIKYFACGFLLCTGLAFFFEMLETFVLQLMLSIAVTIADVQVVKDEDGYTQINHIMGMSNVNGGGVGVMGPYFGGVESSGIAKGGYDFLSPLFGYDEMNNGDNHGYRTLGEKESDIMNEFSRNHPILVIIYLFLNSYALAALVEELCKYFGYKMVDHPDFLTSEELADAASAPALHSEIEDSFIHDDGETTDDQSEHSAVGRVVHDGYTNGNIGMTTNAAAATGTADVNPVTNEATDTALSKPSASPLAVSNGDGTATTAASERNLNSIGSAITIAMVSVAVGFACCENLIYIFFYSGKNLATEISVLIARSLFPIHPIAAAIQSIGVCKRDLEQDKSHKLGRIIFPAILMHGTFDFNIMVTSFISNLFSNNDGAAAAQSGQENGAIAAIVSSALSTSILIAGLVYYYLESKKQKQRLSALDETLGVMGLRPRLI